MLSIVVMYENIVKSRFEQCCNNPQSHYSYCNLHPRDHVSARSNHTNSRTDHYPERIQPFKRYRARTSEYHQVRTREAKDTSADVRLFRAESKPLDEAEKLSSNVAKDALSED